MLTHVLEIPHRRLNAKAEIRFEGSLQLFVRQVVCNESRDENLMRVFDISQKKSLMKIEVPLT
jgi:hypothetical protein